MAKEEKYHKIMQMIQNLINRYIIWKFKTTGFWEKRYRMVESDHDRILDA